MIKDRELLLIEPVYSEDASTVFSPDDPTLPFRLTMEELEVTDDFIIPRDRNTACFDADKLKQPLTVRHYRQGDTFVPFGMTGRKRSVTTLLIENSPFPAKSNNGCFAVAPISFG